MTREEWTLQVVVAQRNEAMNTATNAAVEANVQKERADTLQAELDALKKEVVEQ